MPSMTFRFTTECELTFEGRSYEEAYLKFKDLCQSQKPLANPPQLKVYPPEDSTIYFEVDEQNQFSQMDMMKGDFKQDILQNLPDNWIRRIQSQPFH
ncbi:hypothetical protein HBA55_33410 [Pseudomaricurvus alkylphenolicus]|jgi:hypothetical protein|uniref:hypothetical protein n=1 Tax=Pseudomaricurvus alkylphenolicus TaxID=1306991 RepID=UPI00142077E5|nr:hypothetical protein [Pseudomaricurvus alkylphenolicus]NIB44534.1 hypothetical protein [Pseudomaricurvus alkylphenolicus]